MSAAVVAGLFQVAFPAHAQPTPTSIFGREPDGGAPIDVIGAAPDAGPGAPSPHGSLDKEIIRRIIRRHIADVKVCYEGLLVTDPWAAGQIMIQFTVSASGSVSRTQWQSSTMLADRDHAVADCIQSAMKRWEFPKPLGGGTVVISYPFMLTPAWRSIAAGPTAKEEVRVGAIDGAFFRYSATNADGIAANGLVVKTDAGLLLIDAVWTAAQTAAVMKWAETRFKQQRWIGAVITHDHPDRAGGLAALLGRRIPVGALDLTVVRLQRRGIQGVAPLFKAADRSHADARGFELFYPGAGHTNDNVVVWFPDAKILFGGCLIKDQGATDLGFTGDADLAAWPTSVARVSERYPAPRTVVPGHGEPLARDPYARTLELLKRPGAAPSGSSR